jgi:hypothetical protein
MDLWLISYPGRSFEKDGILIHMVTVFNNHLRGEWFVSVKFTNSKIRFVNSVFAFLEAEAIDGRYWQREEKVDELEGGSQGRRFIFAKRIDFCK